MTPIKRIAGTMAVGLGLAIAAGHAQAAATLVNGRIALGVNDAGHLNTTVGNVAQNAGRTGLSYDFAGDGSNFRDATSPGCFCEGWGVSVDGSVSGSANVNFGSPINLTVDSFSSTATTATSAVHLSSLPGISVTHAYAPADNAPGALFKSVVTIANTTGATVDDVKYVRVMDWDVPLTEFSEYVTIQGTATTTLLERSHDNGFNSADPLASDSPLNAATADVDFVDDGPADHGAYFRFNFGSLADGESAEFTIFYGAAANQREAEAAIAAEGIELFSLGQSNPTGSPGDDLPTYIFGFTGVGGEPVIPDVPEPATIALLGLGLAGFAGRRRKAKA